MWGYHGGEDEEDEVGEEGAVFALHVQQRQNGSLKAPKQELKTIYTPLSPPQLESTGNCFPLQKDRNLNEVRR